MGWSIPPITCRLTPPFISVSSSLCMIPVKKGRGTEAFSCCQSARTGLWGCRGAVLAECWQTSHRGPITFPACQEGVNPRGGGQTLGSMVTECVINAAMCPVPRTFSTLGPFLRLWKRGRGQKEERGASGPPLCHCICPERGYSLCWGLRRMTLVSHGVMGDNRLVSDDGCVEGEGNS